MVTKMAGASRLIAVVFEIRRQKYTKKTEPAKIGLRYVLKRTDVYKKRTFRTQIHVQKRTLAALLTSLPLKCSQQKWQMKMFVE